MWNWGIAVELEPGLEAIAQVPYVTDERGMCPEDVIKVGEDVDVRIRVVSRGPDQIAVTPDPLRRSAGLRGGV